jgi:hypothetical protein
MQPRRCFYRRPSRRFYSGKYTAPINQYMGIAGAVTFPPLSRRLKPDLEFSCQTADIIHTDAQSAEPPKPDQPHQNHRANNRPSLSLERPYAWLSWLVGPCFVLRVLFRSVFVSLVRDSRHHVLTSPEVLYHSARPFYAQQCLQVLAAGCSCPCRSALGSSRSVGPHEVRQLAAVSDFS